ncbi:hypothetical protein [Methanoregula sp.]|uniref:hypothetical protein n=1 Tax=Methanoregula sp. TaxID=2052170 RepID=UPI003C29E0A1
MKLAELQPPDFPPALHEQPTLPVAPLESAPAAVKVTPDTAMQPLSAVIAVLGCTGIILYRSARQ